LRAAEGLERAQWQDEHQRHHSGNHDRGATATATYAYTGACDIEGVLREIFGPALLLLVQPNAHLDRRRPHLDSQRMDSTRSKRYPSRYRDSTVRTASARLQIRSGKPRPSIHQRLDIQEAPLRRVRPLHTIQEPLFTPNRTIKDQNTLLTHPARPLALLPLLARGPCMLRHQHKRRGRQRQGEMRARA
jgi:hypothetical protein